MSTKGGSFRHEFLNEDDDNEDSSLNFKIPQSRKRRLALKEHSSSNNRKVNNPINLYNSESESESDDIDKVNCTSNVSIDQPQHKSIINSTTVFIVQYPTETEIEKSERDYKLENKGRDIQNSLKQSLSRLKNPISLEEYEEVDAEPSVGTKALPYIPKILTAEERVLSASKIISHHVDQSIPKTCDDISNSFPSWTLQVRLNGKYTLKNLKLSASDEIKKVYS